VQERGLPNGYAKIPVENEKTLVVAIDDGWIDGIYIWRLTNETGSAKIGVIQFVQ